MDKKEYAMLIARNIQYYMSINEKTQSDLARDLKINKATVSSWYNGTRIPRPEAIDLLCHYFNIKRSDLMEDNAENRPMERTIPLGTKIPVLGKVAAGLPIEAIENVIDWEEIPNEIAKKGEHFALVIKGDSMEPRMYDGDVVIVRKQNTAESGQIVIATVNGDDATCKRFMQYGDSIGLVSLNSKYPPMVYTQEQQKSLPIQIWGVVIEIRGKLVGI